MKKIIVFLFLFLLSFCCTGCSNSRSTYKDSLDSESASDTTTPLTAECTEELLETLEMPETLRFVDAWEEWHEVDILPNAKKHSYDWNYLTNNENGISYVGDDRYSIRKGIDVSKWQGNIEWEKVKADGYDFVFIRLGYRGYSEAGELELDSKFHKNIQGAQAAGLDVGVYFFSQAINEEEALEEAEFVINALSEYHLQLPVVYDPELIRDTDARTNNVTGEQFTQNTLVFCNKIKEVGFEPMIYSNMFWEAFLFNMTQLEMFPIWYADYEAVPQTPYDFSFWQYSETGTVDGINANVDLNIQFIPN